MGNSCFAASSLQSLASARPLVRYLLAEPRPHPPCGKRDCVLCTLCSLLEDMEATSEGEEAPPPPPPSLGPLMHIIRRVGSHFQTYRQEDTHDFVHVLLDRCHITLLEGVGGA